MATCTSIDGGLEAGGQVRHVDVPARLTLVADVVDDGGLQPREREAVVPAAQHRAREVDRCRIALGGELREDRAAGVPEAEHLGDLVERLPRRVVERLAERVVLAPLGHVDERGVPAADHERHERRPDLLVGQDVGEEVPLEVVHAHERHSGRDREPLRVRQAHDERADEPRTVGDRDRVEVAEGERATGSEVLAARSSASSTTPTIASVCLRLAISGTTPPKRAWKSIWLAITLDERSRGRLA